MTGPVDSELLQLAKVELAQSMIPVPDDYLGDLGPVAAVWYLEQLAWATLRHFTALLSTDAVEQPDDDSAPVRALAGLGVVAGAIDQVCIDLGLLPAEAGAE